MKKIYGCGLDEKIVGMEVNISGNTTTITGVIKLTGGSNTGWVGYV